MSKNLGRMPMYIGTKVVHAMPTTLTEAQKVLGREIKPATVEKDGYLVEYKDGYKSWSPKSVFEEAYHKVGSVRYKPSSVNRGSKTDMAGDRRARGGR